MKLLVAALPMVAAATPSKCYALALSGGSDHGAWEAGAVQGLVNRLSPEQRQWSVVTGISMGGILSSTMALFDVGSEADMAAFLVDSVLRFTNTPGTPHVYQNWSAGVDPSTQTGYYNTTPLFDTLVSVLGSRPLGNRSFTVGATSMVDGELTVWDERDILDAAGAVDVEKWASYVRASTATAGTFESVTLDGDVYSDGSLRFGTDIFSAVHKCTAAGFAEQDIVVDVVTANGATLPAWTSADNKTLSMASRGQSMVQYNQDMAAVFDACRAYPKVNWRHFVQGKDLPNTGMDFNLTEMQAMVQAGAEAAATAASGIHCQRAEALRNSKRTPRGSPVEAVTDKCYALALSGGGDKGAWEAGVVKGLVGRLSAEERRWSVVTGISAGSIVTSGMALYNIGDEAAMADFLVSSVLNFTNTPGPAHVFEGWPLGYLQALGESGLYHTDLMYETLRQTLSLRPLADRKFVIGATDVATALPVLWEEGDVTNSDGSTDIDLWAKIVRASSAVPGAFQTVLIDGVTHSDGGSVMGTNVFSAVTRCLEAGYAEGDVVVDVITTNTDVLQGWSANEDNVAPQLQARGDTVQSFNREMADIDDACNAYPGVSWRFYVQAGDLPSNGANFNATQMQEMVEIGMQAAEAAEVGVHCAVADANRPSKIVPKLWAKKRREILLV